MSDERTHDEHTPTGPAWRLGLILGGALFAFGVVGLLRNATQTLPGDWLAWVVGAVLVHDVIVAPVVLACGFLLARLVPASSRGVVQATLAVCATVALMSVPVLVAAGRRADNPSLLPHDYARNLAIVLAAILAAVALERAIRRLARPAGRRD